MRFFLFLCVLLLGVFRANSVLGVTNTCNSVPVSLANITNCIDDTCTATTTTTVNIPNLIGSSACLEFLSPNGDVSSYALNITVSAVNLEYQFDYCYFTDDPPGESKGLCGCPGGTTALCPCNSVSFSNDFVTVCSAGTHDDSDCILNHLGRTGTWCGKTIFYTHPRYLLCHSLGSVIKSVNLTINDQAGEWLVHYDGSYNYVALNDTVSNVRIISDSVTSSFTPEFVFFDSWNPESMYYYTSGECNSLNEFDVQKLGWNKFYHAANNRPNTTALVSPQFGNWIKWKITDCNDNKFQVTYPQFNIQSFLNSTIANKAEHITPNAYIRDSHHRVIAGQKRRNQVDEALFVNYYTQPRFILGHPQVGPQQQNQAVIYNTNMSPALMDGTANFVNLTVNGIPFGPGYVYANCQYLGGLALEETNIIFYCVELTYQEGAPIMYPNGRAFIAESYTCNSKVIGNCPTVNFRTYFDAYLYGTATRFTIYPHFSLTPLFQIKELEPIPYITNNYLISLVDTRQLPMQSSFLNPLDLATFSGVTPTFMSGVTLVVPATLGSFFVEVEFKNVTVTFHQSGVKPKIKSVKLDDDKEHIIIQASSMTSAGSCYVYSYPEGLFLTAQIDLITTVQTFTFPLYAITANGSYSVGIRCYQYSDQQGISVNYDHSSNVPDHYKPSGTPGWSNSWNPGNLWDTVSSLFDGNFGIPALISSIVYFLILIAIIIGTVVVGLKLLKCILSRRKTPKSNMAWQRLVQKHGVNRKME